MGADQGIRLNEILFLQFSHITLYCFRRCVLPSRYLDRIKEQTCFFIPVILYYIGMFLFQSIVHDNLISPHIDERADAAKHLGMLQCGDTLVMYALKERLKHDEEDRVRYEAAKALILLGKYSGKKSPV